ncbi:bifunctional proline dehydrogenase/L-glutamate gamma-semialdehyde dehydrogenase [Spiractinospora alimapuensis]|uniref:bifunctional proline dehydrogenase/L-glutamate gamma-semialdehyde dehydrogenase n=1 Tax=Spiractinospora alimapuensis TaxID=2820884 RepID=UPI001F3C3D10|nr:bifunctional proline dehydrogenase/L-glutamate gamma-semialdehyde dehydrogenase [Spiractinospora alimapuensis]QVQ52862.1 bifunctional proline dehydrogenase/L-glutamate gamma-semialdehyde dehydrogenase [Spiractinospora alimapuensis]
MSTEKTQQPTIDDELVDEAVTLVRRWIDESRGEPVDAAAKRLAGVLQDPNGLAFTVGFVDGVVRPEDHRAAAAHLRTLVPLTPRFLPWAMRAAIRVGAQIGRVLPGVVVPVARATLRRMVRHLIIDASDTKLGPAIERIRASQPGVRLNVNLLGEAILGQEEAERRVEGTRSLLAREDVDYVSIKVSSTVAPHSPWAFDTAVAEAVDALAPLYRQAKTAPGGPKFINLDMEEYKDLDLTLAVFTSLLDREEFTDFEAGIVLQAYLPDALAAMERLQEWATRRVDAGGAPVKVRVVKGANLPMERVDAEVHGWPLATWGSKEESDASYKAVLDYALRPEHTRAVRIGVAGHNLFDLALAWLLAGRRGCRDGVDIEMLLGMATAQAAVVRRDIGGLLLYTPVVHPREFDVAIAYLVRRLEEGASSENFMSAVFELDHDTSLFERERDRFAASVAAMPASTPEPHRVQDRTVEQPAHPVDRFVNTPDTDTALGANRAWGAGIRARMRDSDRGLTTAAQGWVETREELDALVSGTVAAGDSWRELGPEERARILHRAGEMLQRRRADLLEVMGSECGKVLEQSDPEVSEAIDFAHYYAELGRALNETRGARFEPNRLTVVTPPWNFPVAIPTGSTLAALAAGAAVIIKPAEQAHRCAAVIVEALWEAGVPRDVLRYVRLSEHDLGSDLIAHPSVERVILTGAYETAELFRSMRRDLPLLAETSGKNAIIVTPSADLDLAARDVATSAFGHAGQKCSAASLVILVGSVATSERFRRQLLDAVRSLHVGPPWDERSQVGPIVEPASGKLLSALTTLGPGESWVLEPERLDDSGMLWRPGIREGVRPGSEYHLTEYFGPVLGIMTAETLDEAIGWVNQIEYGLTSGLHALDETEIQRWLGSVEAGNVYVNRGITGAIVQRQPFGGWKKSAVGPGTKAGGPNYLKAFGTWSDEPVDATPTDDALSRDILDVAESLGVEDADRAWLAGALSCDAEARATEFGVVSDATGLIHEHNALRYHPVPVTIRAEGARVVELLRVVAAAARVGGPFTVSTSERLPKELAAYLAGVGAEARVEEGERWHARCVALAQSGGRVRLVGADADEVVTATDGSPALAVYGGEVVSAGTVELLPFLREQAVSITAHRFGTPQRYDIPPVLPQHV